MAATKIDNDTMYLHRATHATDCDGIPQSNPVHSHCGSWYFWIETWADREGPFASQEEAKRALKKYEKELL